eukprot:g8452.t1
MMDTTVAPAVAASGSPCFVLEPLLSDSGIEPIVLRPGTVSIGASGDCALPINIPGIAPRHGTIVTEGKRTVIRSEDSRTWLNDGPVTEAQLRAGDRLAIGPLEFRVRIASSEELARSEPVAETQTKDAWAIAAEASISHTTRRPAPTAADPIGIKAAFQRAIAEGILPASAASLLGERLHDVPPAHIDVPQAPSDTAAPNTHPAQQSATERERSTDLREDVVRRLDEIQKEIGRQQDQITELLDPPRGLVEPEVNWLEEAKSATSRIVDAGRKESLMNDLLASLQERSDELRAREKDETARLRRQQDRVSRLRNDAAIESAQYRSLLENHQQQFESQCRAIESQRTELDQKLAAVNAQTAALTKREQELSRRAAELTALKTEAESDRIKAEEEWNQIRSEQLALTEDFARLEKQRKTLTDAELELESEMAEVYRERDMLREKLAAESVDRQRAIELEEQLGERDSEIARLALHLQSVQSSTGEQIEQSEWQLSELRDERNRLQAECAELERRIHDTTETISDSTQRQAELEQREAEVEEERRQIASAREELDAMRAELDKRHAATLAETEQQQQRLDELQQRDRSASIREEQCEVESTRLQSESARLDELRSELETRRQEFESLEESKSTEGAELDAQRSNLDTRLTEYEEERARLDRDLSELKASQQQLQTERDSLAAEREELEKERDLLKSDRELLDLEREELTEQQERLEAAERSFRSERDELKAELELARAEQNSFHELQTQLDRQRDFLQESHRTLESDRARLAERETKLDDGRAELDRLRSETRQLNEERDRQWNQRQEELRATVEEENARLAEERDRIAEREAAIEEQRAETERLREELERLEGEAETALEIQQQEFQKRELAVEADEKRLAAERETLAQQQHELQQSREEIERLRDDLTSLEDAELSNLSQRQQDIDNRQSAVEAEEQRLAAERDRLEEEKLELELLREEAEQLSEQLTRRQEEEESKLKARQQELEERQSAIETEERNLAEQRDRLEQQQSELNAGRQEVEKLREELAQLETEEKSTFAERQQELQQRLDAAEAEEQRLAKERAQFDSQKAELNASREEVEQLREELAQLETEEKPTLTERQQELQERLDAAEAEEQRLAEERAQFDAQKAELDASREEVEQLREELAQLETEEKSTLAERQQELQQRLDAAEAEEQRLAEERAQFDAQKAELDASRQEVEKLREELAQLETEEKSTLTERQQELQERLDAAEAEEQRLAEERAQFDAQKAELESTREELERLRDERSLDATEEESALAQRRQELEERQKAVEAEEERLAAERERLAAEKTELTESRQQLEQQQEQAPADDVDDLELSNRQEELERRQTELNEEDQRLAEERRQLTEQKAELDACREEIEAQRAAFQQQVDERDSTLQQHKLELQKQREALETAREEHEAARAELAVDQANLKVQMEALEQARAAASVSETTSPVSSETETDPEPETAGLTQTTVPAGDDDIDTGDVRSLLSELFEMPGGDMNSASAGKAPEKTPEAPGSNITVSTPPVTVQRDQPAIELESMKWFKQAEESAGQPTSNLSQTSPTPPSHDSTSAQSDESGDVYEVDDSAGTESEENDSIATYMQQLLARNNRGNAGTPSYAASRPSAPNETTGAESSNMPHDGAAGLDPILSETTRSLEGALPGPKMPPRPRVVPDKVAARADMSSMRELANMSARKAIAAHSWKRLRVKVLIKTIIFVTSLVTAIVLLTSGIWLPVSNVNYGLAALAVAAVTGFEVVRTKVLFDSMGGSQNENSMGLQSEEDAASTDAAEGDEVASTEATAEASPGDTVDDSPDETQADASEDESTPDAAGTEVTLVDVSDDAEGDSDTGDTEEPTRALREAAFDANPRDGNFVTCLRIPFTGKINNRYACSVPSSNPLKYRQLLMDDHLDDATGFELTDDVEGNGGPVPGFGGDQPQVLKVEARKIEAVFERATEEIGKVFVGQDELVEAVLIALFSEGNVLIEGVPGLGKTLLVNTLSHVLSASFRRIQFTPDLMPSDVTGHSIYDMKDREFTFNPGPIFTNLLLADEINRAPAKTQSALLEAMQERQVTVDGTTYALDRPFITIATQNPLEQEGTYPLPEAQLDRFMFKLIVDYPTQQQENGILEQYASGRDNRDLASFGLRPVVQSEDILTIQQSITSVIVEPTIINYITAIVNKTRTWHTVEVGASPRASVNILLAARTMAACRGRDFVVPDDVKSLAVWVLRHRLRLRPDAEIEGFTNDDVVQEVLDSAGDVMSVGARNAVHIKMRNRNRQKIVVEVHDEPPGPCTIYDLPEIASIGRNRQVTITYHAEPHHRGQNRFGTLFLRSRSRLRLWTFTDMRQSDHPVRVYPDIQAVHRVELLARQNRLAEAGVKMSRLRGRGNEFERLREYRREDEYRSIDWKATARHQELISREYVVEKNQNLLFLLDCGRSMCNETDGITHFDRALNAAILLSYVALRQGDTVGIMACSNRVERWVPPVRGTGAVQSLIRQTYELEPTYEASDYGMMAEQLRARYRKRSLIVLVTHALDEVHLANIGRHMAQMRSPHLVLGAFLRNVPLHERLDDLPATDLDAFQIAAAADMMSAQSTQIAKLEKSGLLVTDSLPENLSAELISQYLEIKARHLL